MALFLREDDVANLLSWDDAAEAVAAVLQAHAAGQASNEPRLRVAVPRGSLTLIGGDVAAAGYAGMKAYTVFPRQVQAHTWLYDRETGALDAVVQSLHLSTLRTGALVAVATRTLAGAGPWEVGLLGSGRHARACLQALAAIGGLRSVRAWSPTPDRLQAFCQEMSAALDVPVEPAAPEAVAAAPVVTTVTSAAQPVLRGDWLQPGAHVNAVGSNHPHRRELDAAAVAAAATVVVEDVAAARAAAGDLVLLGDRFDWGRAVTLGAVLNGRVPGRERPDAVTLFKSVGVPILDIALGALAVHRARAAGLGEELPL